jgi:hypothetical protein
MPAKAAAGEGAELIELAIQKRVFVHSRKLGAKDRLKTFSSRFVNQQGREGLPENLRKCFQNKGFSGSAHDGGQA